MCKENSVLAIHMKDGFERLSPLLQEVHLGKTQLDGIANVQRGNFIAQLISKLFRFPKENASSRLRVVCDHTSEIMTWKRNFDGLKMESSFRKQGEYLVEYLGPLAMSFKAIENAGALEYRFVKTRLWGIPVPNLLSPQIKAGEMEVDGKYQFSVMVKMFLVGHVISYSGEMSVS
ncbi:MAG: DUF4166 domain-containing protein [Cellvibrionaceae bacterium]